MCESCEAEAERRKKIVGMAEYGTAKYWRNAEFVLDAYRPGHRNAETQGKLEWLRRRNRYDC